MSTGDGVKNERIGQPSDGRPESNATTRLLSSAHNHTYMHLSNSSRPYDYASSVIHKTTIQVNLTYFTKEPIKVYALTPPLKNSNSELFTKLQMDLVKRQIKHCAL